MGKYMKNFIITILLIALMSLIGCQKNPAPKPSGNANVKSRIFSVASWERNSPYYFNDLVVPEITSSNIDSAAIMVYCDAGKGSCIALPYTQYGGSNYYMNYSTKVGAVQINWVCNSCVLGSEDPNEYYGLTTRFKVVVIPPGARLDIDLTDYEAVKAEYKLID